MQVRSIKHSLRVIRKRVYKSGTSKYRMVRH